MATNSTLDETDVCHSIYYVIGNAVIVGIALFGIVCGILALITIPRLRLGICPSVLLFILAMVDFLILAFQVPQVILLENDYDTFAGSDAGSLKWYLRGYARRLRLTLYLYEGWLVICLTLNRFIFVRWPYYDGKYMTCKCAVISVLSLGLLTLILEAPAFGKIVMSQLKDGPMNGNETKSFTTDNPFTTEARNLTTQPFDLNMTTGLSDKLTTLPDDDTTSTAQMMTVSPSTIGIHTTEEITSTQSILTTETLTSDNSNDVTTELGTMIKKRSLNSEATTASDELSTANNINNNVTSDDSFMIPKITGTPIFAGVMLEEILKIRDTYVEVLDRFVTTLVPILVVMPFLIVMAAMLPGGHPRMRTLSHEVIMERSAVVIMLTGVTWYVLANLPYQIFSLVTWISGKRFKCEADLLFHVTTITLTCAFKPLIFFIVCPHFRRTLGSTCGSKKTTKESFGTPSFDRISSRILSTPDLNISRDSRDSRGSFFDVRESTEL